MKAVPSRRADQARRHQKASAEIRNALRELRIQLALLNYSVGSQVGLKDIDLDCLDILDTSGPLSPSALAQRASLHPATMTGILDRLEGGGWVVRERDPSDRRAVVVRALRDRNAELVRLYGGMNSSMSDICGSYSVAELAVLADFLRRTAEAGPGAPDQPT